jgi:flagellar hook-associated protein 1 FlgK
MPARETMLSTAQTLSGRFQALDKRLTELNMSVNAQIESTVLSVNAYAREIAALNGRIAVSQTNPGQPANDLLDKRDQLISELNKLVGATAVIQPDGIAHVSIGNGQSLVVANQAFSLATVQSLNAPEQTEVAFVAGSSRVMLGDHSFNGGSLGAILAFRSGPLRNAQNEMGRIAVGLAESVNAQHRLGQDLRGNLGTDFFTQMRPHVTPRSTNTGTADITASFADVSALEASDYRLTFSAGNYQLTRLRDNTTTTFAPAALPRTVDGITITLAGGVPADGDSFAIEPTRYAAQEISVAIRDAGSIAAAAPMRTGSTAANTGTGAISEGVVDALHADLQDPVSIVFTSATTFNVTNTSTGVALGTAVAFTPGADITYNGWTVRITGAPATGDTFTVSSNTGGTADNRNAQLMAGLQTAHVLSGSTASFQDSYGQLTSSVGNTVREAEIAADAQAAIALGARETQQGLSGVNLDEEAANLMRYQQAYQASGKVIEVATTLFDTILSIGGR